MTVVADPCRLFCEGDKHMLKIEQWHVSDRRDGVYPPPWHYEAMTVITEITEAGCGVTTFPSYEEFGDVKAEWVHGQATYFHEALREVVKGHARYCKSPIQAEHPGWPRC